MQAYIARHLSVETGKRELLALKKWRELLNSVVHDVTASLQRRHYLIRVHNWRLVKSKLEYELQILLLRGIKRL
ncbi:MAG TPA: hypothetical protein VIM11_07025 [Tepidisphaeraceae bacterium]